MQVPRTGIGYDVHRFAEGRRMVLGGVEGLFADVVSRPALELLAGAGIAVEYTVVVPGIMNRAGTGTCPVEQLCAGAETAAECLPLIEGFMQKMKEQHG